MINENASVNFDRAAEYYDETRAFPKGLEETATHLFLEAAPLSAEDSVLEIGVGTGRIAIPLTTQFSGPYFGVDISTAMLGKLKSKPGAERLHISIGDATRLPYPDTSFSAVLAVHVFHLIPWRETLTEVARVLKPGGLLMHGWNYEIDEDDIDRVWEEAVQRDRKFSSWYQNRDASSLIDAGWLPAGPFREIEITIHKTPRSFLDGIANRRWSRLWSMNSDEINKGLQAVEAYLREENIDPDAPRELRHAFRVQAYHPPEAG